MNDKFSLKKRTLKILLVIGIVLAAIIVFRYEIAYNFALKSIPLEKTHTEGVIIVEQDLNKVRDIAEIKYNSELFENSNKACVIIFGALILVLLMINRMCKCKNCKKHISIWHVFKIDSFECPYCDNTEL